MSTLELPTYATIPYQIQADLNLPDSVKLFYGQIAGLAIKYGYLWASNEQLAYMKKTSVKNVERWLKILEKFGYLKRVTKNFPKKEEDGKWAWEKRRKIYLLPLKAQVLPMAGEEPEDPQIPEETPEPEEQSESLGTLKNEGTLGTLIFEGTLGTLKNEGIISNSKDVIFKQESETVVVSSDELEKIDIELKLKIKIMENHSPEEIRIAVDRCLKWKSRPSDAVGIMTALKKSESWIDNETPEKIEEKNGSYLKSLRNLDGKKLALNTVVIGNNYIEFVCGSKCTVFSTDNKEFKKLVVDYLEYLNKWESDNG